MIASYIYGLYDPRNSTIIKYVGYTSFAIIQRLQQHIVEAKYGKSGHKNNWIRKLINEGVSPHVKQLEKVTSENWQEREIYWIAFYAETVTNCTAGGEGLINPSKEVRDKIAAKVSILSKGNQYRKGIPHTEKSKKAISDGLLNSEKVKLFSEKRKGIKLEAATEATRLINTGIAKTNEHRARISSSMKSSDVMKKAVAIRTGLKLPSASAKKLGSRFINDGTNVRQIKKDKPLPVGWVYGMKIKT